MELNFHKINSSFSLIDQLIITASAQPCKPQANMFF